MYSLFLSFMLLFLLDFLFFFSSLLRHSQRHMTSAIVGRSFPRQFMIWLVVSIFFFFFHFSWIEWVSVKCLPAWFHRNKKEQQISSASIEI